MQQSMIDRIERFLDRSNASLESASVEIFDGTAPRKEQLLFIVGGMVQLLSEAQEILGDMVPKSYTVDAGDAHLMPDPRDSPVLTEMRGHSIANPH